MTREELMREIEAAVRGHHIASCRSTVLPCESFKAGALFLVDRLMKAEEKAELFFKEIKEQEIENNQLRSDRSAFAEETQKYRDAWVKDQTRIDQLLAGILEKDELIKEGLAVDAELRARIERLREALENIGAVNFSEKDIRACGGDAFVTDAMIAREALDADKEQTWAV